MKNILLIVSSSLLLVISLKAQDEDKKVRFGLKISPTPTWFRSDNKNIEKSGTNFGFGFGLQTEFRINSTTSFVTGIGGDMLGGKQAYKNNAQGYVLNKDNEYVDSKQIDFLAGASSFTASSNSNKFYEIKSRSVKATYVTIPLLLKLKTKDISGMKYFGMFGGNIAIQTKFNATDEVALVSYNSSLGKYEAATSTSKIEDLRPSGDLIPVNLGLNVGIGAEYILSGSTSLFFSIHYLRGFINQYQRYSDIMVDNITTSVNSGTEPARSKQNAFSDAIQLNIGILF